MALLQLATIGDALSSHRFNTRPPHLVASTSSPRCHRRLSLVSAVSDPTRSPLLEVNDLKAVVAETKQPVLKGVDLLVFEGEVHAIMGKNGSGKSTLSKVLGGHPDYEVTGGIVIFRGKKLLDMVPEERSLAGLFISFQSPIEIPGVSNLDFLHMAYNARRRKLNQPELGPLEFFAYVRPKLEVVKMKPEFLNRSVNEGFSGGERKRNEILQLAVLGAELTILDEIDSGLDVDALRDVADVVNGLMTKQNSTLLITHYFKLLEYIKPSMVHIMDTRTGQEIGRGEQSQGVYLLRSTRLCVTSLPSFVLLHQHLGHPSPAVLKKEDGRIVKSATDISIARAIDKGGYKSVSVLQ